MSRVASWWRDPAWPDDREFERADRSIEEIPKRRSPDQSRARGAERSSPDRDTRPNQIAFAVLCGVVIVAPLPYGSVDFFAIAFWCIVLGVALIFAAPDRIRTPHVVLMICAALLIGAYAFVLHEQLSETPWVAQPDPIWSDAAALLGTPLAAVTSVVRNQPYYALGAPVSNMLALLVGFLIGTDRENARRLFRIFAWAGAAYAVYGVVAFAIDPTKVLLRDKLSHTTSLTATYLNRNTAAVFFGSCSLIWLLSLCEATQRRLPDGPIEWRSIPYLMFSNLPHSMTRAYIALALCVVAMFMTRSRAGVLISGAVMIFAFMLFFRRAFGGRKSALAALFAACVVALGVFQVLGAGVEARLELEGISDSGRLDTYRTTLRMIADRPWFGTGLGTFAWAHPEYRSSDITARAVWDRAHSTPLELAAELGLPLTGGIVLGWAVILAVLLYGALAKRRNPIVPLSALCIALVGLLHSLIDFSLQIPGYSIPLFALIGAGLAQSLSRRSRVDLKMNEKRSDASSARPVLAEF